MSKPSFSQIKNINDLLKKIEKLESDLESKKKELEKTENTLEKKADNYKRRLIIEGKQQALLDKIKEEIQELRLQEKRLRSSLFIEVDKEIQKFIQKGGLEKFLQNLYQNLSKEKSVEIEAGEEAKKYLSKNLKVDIKSDTPQVLRFIQGVKTYIFDLDKLKASLLQKIINTKLPSKA